MKRVPLITKPRVLPRVPQSVRVADGIRNDSLQNIVTGLGTSKDKLATTSHVWAEIPKGTLEAAYRGDWIARKIINIPAQDATREWRTWHTDKEDITTIEEGERDFNIRVKVKSALIRARLYGGAAILMGVEQGTVDQPLEVEKIKKDALKFLHVVSKWELSAGEIDWDAGSDNYGLPKYYMRAQGDGIKIHPSRVVRFLGNEVPDVVLSNGWGDSVLQAVNDAIIAAGMTTAAGAQLLSELKMDIVKIPSLTSSLANKQYAQRLTDRFGLASVTKSLYNVMLLDGAEEWERITANLTGLPDTLRMYLMIASGAADIPSTRMLGQSPAGLSSTGESDLRNYYDHVKSEQNTTIQPAMTVLDEVFIRSILGTADPDSVKYKWTPLWQLDEQQRSTVIGQKSTAFQIDVTAGLIPPEVLRDARINQLVEDGVYPGLEQILDEYGPLDPIDEEPAPGSVVGPGGEIIAPNDPAHPENQKLMAALKGGAANENDPKQIAGPKKKGASDTMTYRIRNADVKRGKYRRMSDGVMRSLYVSRPVLNAKALLAWAKEAGIPDLEPANELHVTLMYSQTPVDWSKTGDDWGNEDDGTMRVRPGGMRALQKFGNAIVLCFNNSNLAYRHCQIKESTGATWDYGDYQPHVTLAHLRPDSPPVDLTMPAYNGEIKFGPEVYAETGAYSADKAYAIDYNENHDPSNGEFTSGEGGGSSKAALVSRGAKVREVVKKLASKEGAKTAGKAVLKKLDKNKAAVANGAIQASLYHVAGIDYGPDIEKLIAHEIEHFADNAKIAYGVAKDYMKKVGEAYLKYFQAPYKKDAMLRDDDTTSEEIAAMVAVLKDFLKAVDAYEAPAEEGGAA